MTRLKKILAVDNLSNNSTNQINPIKINPIKNEPIKDESLNGELNPVQAAQVILDRIDEASDNLKDVYYALFDNLNALYKSYPTIYKQIEMIVKLPTNEDAELVTKFNNDLLDIISHFDDMDYLDSYINPDKTDEQLTEENSEQSIEDILTNINNSRLEEQADQEKANQDSNPDDKEDYKDSFKELK